MEMSLLAMCDDQIVWVSMKTNAFISRLHGVSINVRADEISCKIQETYYVMEKIIVIATNDMTSFLVQHSPLHRQSHASTWLDISSDYRDVG